MHTASYVYVVLILYIITSKRNVKEIFVQLVALYAFTYISVEAGNFIDAYGIRLSYDRFVQIILLFFTAIILMHRIICESLYLFDLKRIGLALFSALIGIGNLILRPANVLVVNGETLIDSIWNVKGRLQYPEFSNITISTFIAYGIFLIILYAIFLDFNRNDYLCVLNTFVRYSKILVVFGYMEFLSKLLISNQLYPNLIISFWGTNSAIAYADQLRNGLPMLYGWTQEPSHFAYTLFVIMVAMLAHNSVDKHHTKWIIAAGLLLIFTMAFSALLFAVTYIAILYINRKKGTKYYLKRMLGLVAVSMLIIGIMWGIVSADMFADSFFGERLKNIFNELPMLFKLDIQNVSSLEYSSHRVRLVSSFSTLKLILYRPLFGLGIGTLASHGSSATILSSIGVVGVYTWLKAMFGGKIRKFFNINMSAYKTIIIIWFVMGIFMSHFLGMLYGGENYILMIAFAIICKKSRRENITYCLK